MDAQHRRQLGASQRRAQSHIASMSGATARPEAVSEYSNRSGDLVERARATMPSLSSSLSRFDNNTGDMRGSRRRRSLKRDAPLINSPNSVIVQRRQRMSDARANERNCWFLCSDKTRLDSWISSYPYPGVLKADSTIYVSIGSLSFFRSQAGSHSKNTMMPELCDERSDTGL